MPFEVTPKRGVVAQYGQRFPTRSSGVVKTEGTKNELLIDITGQMLADGIVLPTVVPSGATFTGLAKLIVEEAFDLAVGSVVEVGQKGAEATNGVSLTEAELEATGVKDVSAGLAGEWAVNSRLTTDHEIGVAFSAGSVTTSSVGKATLILEYIKE